jgi:glyoxylase-like metal-dependent hydrolase (beta-lactamase superfamily II)
MSSGELALIRREGGPLGERWDLPREGDADPPTPQPRAALVERFSRAAIALTLDAASMLESGRRARAEAATGLALAPGVRMLPVRTPTLPPATHTNLFVVGTGEAVLIEPATPYDDELERVVQWIGALEREGLRLREILLTHHHADHVGGARALARALGLPIAAHAETGARLPADVALTRTIEDGERIALDGTIPLVLRAVHTPGHAPGHLCFLEERSGILVAGDMVAGVGTILIEPGDGDMALYLESLRRMGSLGASVLAPAHGGVLRPPQEVLARYIRHRLDRERRVLGALARFGEDATPWDLLPDAYADVPRAAWPWAALSTEAHLRKLEREGRVERSPGGRWRLRSAHQS